MGYNREFEINEEQVAEFLESAVNHVKADEDVDVLADLSKLFKKNVSLSVRKYVTAYLLKESLKHCHFYGKSSRHSSSNTKFAAKNKVENKSEYKAPEKTAEVSAEPRPHHERVQIAPEDATSIFISIGKNRRVYPRDLVGLLIGVAGLERERIGDIKVLANYSFVQLYTDDAQGAIDKLNGYDYRGRKLAVSFSRQKSDEDVVSEENEIAEGFAADSITDEQMAAEDAAAYAAAEKAAADKEPFGL